MKKTKFFFKKQFEVRTRYIVILVSIGAVLMFFGLGTYGLDYLQVQGLLAESKQLSTAGRYKEAINKLSEATSKWSTDSVKAEVQENLATYRELDESNENYEQGLIQYNGENYERAIEYFDKVVIRDDNYKTAQNYKELAQRKLTEPESSNQKYPINETVNTNKDYYLYQDVSVTVTQPVIAKPDNSTKVLSIVNLVGKIGSLNKYTDPLKDEIQKNLEESNKCSTAYTYPTVSVIYSPEEQSSLINQCRNSFYSIINRNYSEISYAQSQIRDAQNQIQQIILSCGKECLDAYNQAVASFEAKGYTIK